MIILIIWHFCRGTWCDIGYFLLLNVSLFIPTWTNKKSSAWFPCKHVRSCSFVNTALFLDPWRQMGSDGFKWVQSDRFSWAQTNLDWNNRAQTSCDWFGQYHWAHMRLRWTLEGSRLVQINSDVFRQTQKGFLAEFQIDSAQLRWIQMGSAVQAATSHRA